VHGTKGILGRYLLDTPLATADAQEAELGYELHPDYWGHGYATEAAWSMLAFGFHTLPLQRV
jgi:ribosomal-protein-alanine N-acetyltransferase